LVAETALLAMGLRTYTAELAQNLRTGNKPMPPPATIKEFWYHEFKVRLLKDGRAYLVIAWDRQNREVARTAGETLEDVEAEISAELSGRSADFIGLPGAINLFRRAFPDGFGSPFYEHYEGYKANATAFVRTELTQEFVKSEIDAGRHEVVAALARRAFSKSNLTSQYEQMALGNALKDRKNLPIFARGFYELLYGEFNAGLQRLAALLKPYKAAKWPILTYWPFFRFPDRHAFLKPEIAKASRIAWVATSTMIRRRILEATVHSWTSWLICATGSRSLDRVTTSICKLSCTSPARRVTSPQRSKTASGGNRR
jgi:hypothetical protein